MGLDRAAELSVQAELADQETVERQSQELEALEAIYPDVLEAWCRDAPLKAELSMHVAGDQCLRLRVDLPAAYPVEAPPAFALLALPCGAPATEGDQLLDDLRAAVVGQIFQQNQECLADVVGWLLAEGVPALEERLRARAAAQAGGAKAAGRRGHARTTKGGTRKMQRACYWFASVGPRGDRIGALQPEFPDITGVISINARPALGVFEGPWESMERFLKELRAQGNNRGQLGLREKATEMADVMDEGAATAWRKFDQLYRLELSDAKQLLAKRGLLDNFGK